MLKHAASKQDKHHDPGRKFDLKMNSDNSPVKRDKLRENEIPVKIGRQIKFISGVNNFTKCSDIIVEVLKSLNILECEEAEVNQHYALLESWRGVTKLLSGNSLILRIWRAWSAEQEHVSFVVKRIRHPRPGNSGRGSDDNVGQNWIEKMRAEVRQTEAAGDVSREAATKQESLSVKSRIGQIDTVKPRTNANKERRLSRRNSSLTRPRRAPDTFHPGALTRDLGRLRPAVKVVLKDEEKSQDTSEDSGIVTDDSEARAVSLNSKYYEVRRKSFSASENKTYYEELWNSKTSKCSAQPQTLLKPPPDDTEFYEMAQDIENLQRINLLLEENQEEILALEFEYKMLLEDQTKPGAEILEDFRSEVNRLRDVNSQRLERILTNRSNIEEVTKRHSNKKQVITQLELDINIVEREGKRLESNLHHLNSLGLNNTSYPEIQKLPDKVTQQPEDLRLQASTLV